MSYIEQKARAACRTLEYTGYTYHGGVLWKPPLGKSAEPLLDRITELEAQLADAQKDEARYQWLIEKCGMGIAKNGCISLNVFFYDKHPNHIKEIDAAIDAAIADGKA